MHGGVGHLAFEALEDEARGAACDVDVLADQVGVDARLEVVLGEVDVLDAAVELGGEVVAQPLGVHAEVKIGERADARAARLAHLLAVDRHEAVHVDVIGHAEGGACKVQHRGPEERVKVDDVLADEVNLFGIRVRELGGKVKPLLGAVGLEACKVADRGVEPDVEVLARRIGNFNAEVGRVARDVPVGEVAALEPLLVLGKHFGLHAVDAVGALALRPLTQELDGARVGELEEVVRGGLQHWRRARERALGIDEIGGRVDRAALLARVAVLVRRPALGAGALDEAVCEEHALGGVVELLDLLGVDQARVAQAAVDLLGELGVFRAVGAVPVVERNVKAVKILLAAGGDFRDELLGGDALFLGRDHDRGAVGVVGAHEVHRVAAHSLMTNPDVGLDVLHDVADVKGAVCIGQGGRDEKIALFGCHADADA